MDKIIESTLRPEEKIQAHTWGKVQVVLGALFPSQGILVATDQRILYFEKTHHVEMEFMREIPYDQIARFSVYRDIFFGLAGLLGKMMHLQPEQGEPVRLVGPVDYEEFARYVKSRLPATAKGRVR